MIVDDVGEVISRHAVALYKHVVFEFGIFNPYIAVNFVVILAYPLGGDVLTDNVRFARGKSSFDFFLRKFKTVLVVLSVAVFVGKAFEPLFGAETIIRPALFDKFFGVFHIYVFSLALDVRTVIAAYIGTFVPYKPGFAKGRINKFYRAFHVALLVGILDSQNKLSAVFLGVKISVKRGTKSA